MTVNRTTLLDLPLPVTGTESGTWGDTTNNGLTQYMDIAIAGMSNLTSANFTAGAVTIETTEGTSSATNIVATSAQYAGFRVTSLAQNSTITVGNTGTSPARSYRLINADATYSLTFKATGQTGVTLLPGQSAVVAFNGTDYVIVGMVGAGTATDNAVVRFDGTTGKLVQNSVVTIADSTGDVAGVGALTMGGNLTLSGGTANGVLYLNGSKVATSGSALTFDGTTFVANSNATVSNASAVLRINGTSGSPQVLFQLAGTNNSQIQDQGVAGLLMQTLPNYPLVFGVNSTEAMRLTSTGLGIGTSSPAYKLDLTSSHDGYARQWLSAVSFVSSADAVNGFQLRNLGSGTQGIKFANFANTVEWMRLDSSGNLGLGVTPSGWGSDPTAIEIGGTTGSAAYIAFNSTATSQGYNYWNMYYNGTNNIVKTTGTYPAYFGLNSSGQFVWGVSSSTQTAGATASTSQAMTLHASGGLSLGSTTDPGAGLLRATGAIGSSLIGDGRFDADRIDGMYLRQMANGPMIFATNATERARITSGGDLLVGVTTAAAEGGFTLYPQGSSGAPLLVWNRASTTNTTTAADFRNASTSVGNITYTNTATAYNTSSDYRLKDNPQPLTNSGAFIDALKPRTWEWKTDGSRGVGFIAHEVQEVSSGSVVGEKDAVDEEGKPIMQAMEYGSAEFIANIIAELQSLRQRVALLEGN